MDPDKVDAISKWPVPQSKKELQTFLGLCNFYAKFVCKFADIAAPLHNLLRKDVEWTWSDEHNKAVANLKRALVTAPVLQMPDFTKPFQI